MVLKLVADPKSVRRLTSAPPAPAPLKRSAAEEDQFRALIRVQAKKECVSLSDATERMKRRNWEMATYLRSRGIEVPEYYRNAPAPTAKKK